jgi:hypothetical protein
MADSNVRQTKGKKKNKDGPELPTRNQNAPQLLTLDPSVLVTADPVPVEIEIEPIRITQDNHESVVFIWFDPQEQPTLNLVGPLRAINDIVRTFNDATSCYNAIRSSKDKIFFITSSSNSDLIGTVDNFEAVEAIFVFDPNVENIKRDYPKVAGVFNQQEELFRVIKEVLDIFEQIQLEIFAFEEDKVFLWSQLWKEKVSKKIY